MSEVTYFLKLAERCTRLAAECPDVRTAAHLRAISDEFLSRAARISSVLYDAELPVAQKRPNLGAIAV